MVIAGLYFSTSLRRVMLFWAAFTLTRPLGAGVGDLIDNPGAQGGLAFNRLVASAVIAAAILILIMALPQRATVQKR